MSHQKNKNIFEENRLIFMGGGPEFSRGDIVSTEAKKERKVEDKLDEQGNVVKQGREAATWTVDDLVMQSNNTIAQHRAALAELPPSFNQRLHQEIVRYISNSPDRFDSDEFRGLSNAEYRLFSNAMHSKVKEIVMQYAPTEAEISKKKEAQRTIREATEAARNIEEVELDDIQEDPGPIQDLPTLNNRYGDYNNWNLSLRDQGSKVMEGVGKFQKSFSDFQTARNGLHAYRKFADYFASGDDETMNLMASKRAMEENLRSTKKKLEDAQKKLEKYAKKMAEASNAQKQEKMEERDAHLRRIDENNKLSKKEKKAQKAQYEKLQGNKNALTQRRDELQTYREDVVGLQAEDTEDKIEFAEARRDQLGTYGTIMRASLEELDRMLEDPTIPEEHRNALQVTRDQIAEREVVISGAEIGAEAMMTEQYGRFEALSAEDQRLAQQTYAIDTHLSGDVEPAIHGLDGQIGILDQAMLQFTDSKEDVMAHYEEAFKIYDNIDARVDEGILANSLANERMIGTLDTQQKALSNMNIESPSGVSGFFEATLGAGLSMAGAGVTEFGGFVTEQATELDEILRYATEDMNPAVYYFAKVQSLGIEFAIGTGGAVLEMGGGLLTMVGQPTQAAAGIGSLLGRNANTGEWFDGSTSETWAHMGKAVIQWEHFKEGRIGLGLGRIFPDVVLTLTGAGAITKGGEAAALAHQAARAAGESTMQAIRLAALRGGQVAGAELIGSAERGVSTFRSLGRNAAETFRSVRANGVFESISTGLASRSKIAERIFGREAAARGLSRRQQRLVNEIQEGTEVYSKFKKRKEDIRRENPDLTDSEVNQRIMREDRALFESGKALERKIEQAIDLRQKFEGEFHMETDTLTGMRQRQALYTPEGMAHLQERFGGEVSMTFSDVTGMGIGNKYLHGPGEGLAEARNTVDASFKLMREVAEEVFAGKPYEMVRFGGDEIVFLTRPSDTALMQQFFRRFNEKKKQFLTERIGPEQYQKAKYETNIKAQQKLITQDPDYIRAQNAGPEALAEWFRGKLSPDEVASHPELRDQFRLLAEKRLPPESQWLEPLDFYRAPERNIRLAGRDPLDIRTDLMDELARADNDIAWQKAHPGQEIPRGRTYSDEVAEAGHKYLEEAQSMTEYGERLKVLQENLTLAEIEGDVARVTEIQREIVTVRTVDPGTGAIRLDKGRDFALTDLVPIREGVAEVHITQMDVPYFGVYNNHYNYATADQMMKELGQVLRRGYGDDVALVRDGGNLFVVSDRLPASANRAALEAGLNEVVHKYAFPDTPGTIDRRSAMRREVDVKMATTGATDEFGKVKLHESRPVHIDADQSLWDTINGYQEGVERSSTLRKNLSDGALDQPGETLNRTAAKYEAYLDRYDAIETRLGTKNKDEILAVMARDYPELNDLGRFLEENRPDLARRIREQKPSDIERVNKIREEQGLSPAMKEVLDGAAPLTRELVEDILKQKVYTDNLIMVLSDNPNILLDWQLGSKEALIGRLKNAQALRADVSFIGRTFEQLDASQAANALEKALGKVARGEKIPGAPGLARALERLKKSDPEAFRLLERTDARVVIESDCLEAVLSGNKIEKMGKNGPITVYVGKRNLGQGTFGNVDLVLYAEKGGTHLKRAAFKRANATDVAQRGFPEEIADARLVQNWDHPNIIGILDMGEDWILSETGSKAFDMLSGLEKAAPDELFGMYNDVIDGIEEIWRNGYFHGDIKPQNILTFMEDGRRVVKIIDHTPNPINSMQPRYFTENFAFLREEIVAAAPKLLERGMTPQQAEIWISRAQDTRAITKSIMLSLEHIIDISRLDARLSRLHPDQIKLLERASDIAERGEDILHAGDPNFLLELRQLATDLSGEFVKGKTDPSRPSLAARGPAARIPVADAHAAIGVAP